MQSEILNSMILIIEDNQTQQNIMHVFLKNYGFQLISAYDGIEAFSILENILPDLILLDVMLPGMDGFDICRKLKSNPRTADIPVIFITALRNQQDIITGLQAGGADYLGKPFNQEELIARVSTHLKLKISKDIILDNNEQLLEVVNKQEKIKKALELSEDKFKIAFNANPSIVFIASLQNQNIIEVNQTFLNVMGFFREEVLFKTTAELALFQDIKVRDKLLGRLSAEKSIVNSEVILTKKDGTSFPAIISVELISLNDENCYLSVITDISERKRFEETIRTVNKRYKKISKLTSDFAFSLQKSGEKWEADWTFGSLSKLCGYSLVDVSESGSLTSFINEKLGMNTAEVLEFLSDNSIFEQITKLNKKDGGEVWLRTYLEPEIIDDKLVRIYGSLKDVSKVKKAELELKSSQERFKRITESANSLIGELSADGVFVYANHGFNKLLSYDSALLINTQFSELIEEKDSALLQEKCQSLLATSISQECVLRMNAANGTSRWFNCNANVVNYGKSTQTIVFVCVDIDSRVNNEIELQKAYSDIEALNKNKDTFFSIIAHDLKGPVSSFKYLTETVSSSMKFMSEDELEEAIESLHSNTIQLLTLLEDLLEWGRAQTGRISYNPEVFSIQYLINNTISLSKSNADKKQIKIFNEVPDSVFVFADIQMVSGIFRNLIGNAIKFTGVNGMIRVTSADVVDNNLSNMIEIRVTDNGVGIPEDRIDALFSIESNHSTLGTNEEKGTGLGLILCHEFVLKNGGNIRVESIYGSGSSFVFTLPKGN